MKQSKNLTTGVLDDTVRDLLRTGYNVTAKPRLTVDWNWNRYAAPVAKNVPSVDNEFDSEIFPIESIVEPLRPTKGMSKARIGQSVVSAGYVDYLTPRFYAASPDDKFKYWTSPDVTDATGVFPLANTLTTARPEITYDRVVSANKIVIKTDNTWATPKNHTVHIKSSAAGNWTTASTEPAIANNGQITIWYNGTSWVSTKPANLVTTNISDIQFRVPALGPGIKRNGDVMTYTKNGTEFATDGSNSSLNVIAIEAHLEVDFSNRIIGLDDTFDMGDKSQLYPIGTITSNMASLTLSNHDLVFNEENALSPYYGLIEPNAEVNLEYIYPINGTNYSVQQLKMYVNGWANASDGTTAVELEDYSKYLKEIKPPSFMVENKTASEISWRVLDSVGFIDYEMETSDLVTDHVIPVFWTTGEETVWEVLDTISRASQTAYYIDAYGKFQVKMRDAAFKMGGSIDWNLLGEKVGTSLPDIIDWSPTSVYEANKVTVTYKTTKWKVNSMGYPAMSNVWEPEQENLVLRSSPLKASIDDASEYVFLSQKDVAVWPFDGIVEVDGETIRYEGKQFIYYTYTETKDAKGKPVYSNEVKNVHISKSKDDHKKYSRMTPDQHRSKNHFTGGLKIKKRAIWNSEKRNHDVDINGWSTKLELGGKKTPTQQANPKGFTHNKNQSTVTLNTPQSMKDEGDTFWALRGPRNNEPVNGYKAYGTKLRFNKDKGAKNQQAGFAFNLSGNNEAGYYVEMRLSSLIDGKKRKSISEVCIYSKKGNKFILLKKGSPTAVGAGIWYELDVYHSGSGNNQTISAFINGQKVCAASTKAETAHTTESARFGFFARGKANLDYEYVYAIARTGVQEPKDDFGFYDLKYGGVRGAAWLKEYVWEIKTRIKRIKKKPDKKEEFRHNKYLFDEFGPYVHEVREFDVKFDPFPVRYSYLFNTNEWYAAQLEYNGNPFGAKFTMANVSRDNAVLHGEDNLIYAGASSGVNQVCVVLGQNLEIADDETIERTNDAAILSRGEIPAELSSEWIQSKQMAEEVGDWMVKHWGDSVDEVEVQIFGNPLIEIGDLVDVLYDRQDATPATHKYFVVGTSSSFTSGIDTKVVLRRRRYDA